MSRTRSSRAHTPRLAEALLRLRLPRQDRECVVGDLVEEYRSVRLPLLGRVGAYRWYWGQVLRSLFVANPSPDPGNAFMSSLPQDLRYGVRSLLKAPQFAVLTVMTLALAIGVNTAIFSMLNPVLLRPLPIADPDSMGFIYSTNADRGIITSPVSAADYVDMREQMTSFATMTAVNWGASFILTGGEEPVQIRGFEASANTFDLWGGRPRSGAALPRARTSPAPTASRCLPTTPGRIASRATRVCSAAPSGSTVTRPRSSVC